MANNLFLCFEDNSTATCFDEFLWGKQTHQTQRFSHGDFSLGFPLMSEECFGLMVKREFEHLPRDDYYKRLKSGELDFKGRSEAVDWIWKVHVYYNFGPLSAYLSVNYLDRFLSTYELPRGKAWIMQLLAVACLSLAAKMEEIEVPLSVDLQVEECKFIFEAKTIQRMELLVLSTLKWRMRAVTPFTFMDYFFRKNNDNLPPPSSQISRSVELILRLTRGFEYLEFKPSEVAAAVSISVTRETNLDKYEPCFIKNVQKERVFKCLELIHELQRSAAVHSVPQSPIGVLDVSCLSYKSDELPTVSSANSSQAGSDFKRVNLNKPSDMD